MAIERPDAPKGILQPSEFSKHVTLNRFLPGPRLEEFVEHYWTVRWELPPGRYFVSENLPYPSCHLVFEPDTAYLQGVTTRRFEHRAVGSASVFSVKFRPGMAFPFVGRRLSELRDRRAGVEELFGAAGRELASRIRGSTDVDGRIAVIEAFLTRVLKESGHGTSRTAGTLESCRRARSIVDWIAERRDVTSATVVELHFGTGPRTLQLLFSRYVGVGPKWVIRRYRMLEAVEALHGTVKTEGVRPRADLAALALELGYTDQSHFTNDFRAMTGRTPGEYSRANAPEG
ncbi:AraC family transcriptional regulator [Salinispira pacifica]